MLNMTDVAVNDAVAMALKEQPQIPSNLINVAGRQRTCPMVLGSTAQTLKYPTDQVVNGDASEESMFEQKSVLTRSATETEKHVQWSRA